jgi:hypothetical protein
MSDSDNEDVEGLGLGGILWGNLGEDDQLEVDYLDQVTWWLPVQYFTTTCIQEKPTSSHAVDSSSMAVQSAQHPSHCTRGSQCCHIDPLHDIVPAV